MSATQDAVTERAPERTDREAQRANQARRRRITLTIPPLLFASLVLLIWELYARYSGVRETTLPAPSRIVEVAVAERSQLLHHARVTGLEVLLGFVLAAIVGIVAGIIIHASRIAERTLYPWLITSQTVPVMAVAPIIVTWLGFGIESKITVVVLICFFPVAVNTIDGLRSVDPALLDLLRTMGASPWRRFLMASLPGALPSIFSGLKVAAALAAIGAVIGEWVGSSAGLGYLILMFNSQIRTAHVFAVIIVLSAIGMATFGAVVLLDRLLLPWRPTRWKR